MSFCMKSVKLLPTPASTSFGYCYQRSRSQLQSTKFSINSVSSAQPRWYSSQQQFVSTKGIRKSPPKKGWSAGTAAALAIGTGALAYAFATKMADSRYVRGKEYA